MKKIPSYSIIELIVVMLITTMVIATAYQGYLLFFRQYLSFKDRSSQIAHVSLLDRLMLSDVENSKEIRRAGSFLICDHTDQKIKYAFHSGYILRHQAEVMDTFFVNIGEPEFYFNSSPALDGSLVDRLSFVVEREKDSIRFGYEKKYGADVLINESLKPVTP